MVAQAIVPFDPQAAVEGVKALAIVVRELREKVFVKGQDYGVIPGTNDKEVLLLPGMEKLCRALRLRPEYQLVTEIQDFDKPLFYFRYECRLIEVDTGLMLSSAIGSANSMESKWAWRWVQRHQVPLHLDADRLLRRGSRTAEFAFAIEKAETTGKYGKPAEYWQQFRDAIADGTATKVMRPTRNGQSEAWEIDMTLYRVPNPDVFDQVNTIDKIAQKRSLGSAIKGAANVSELFTVDLEDMPEFGVIVTKPLPDDAVEGEFSEEPTAPAPTPPPAQSTTDANRQRLGNTGDRRAVNGSNRNGNATNGASSNTNSDDLRDKEVASRFIQRWRAQSLSDSEVLAALGVTKLSEWTKGRKAADDAVNAWLAGELADAADDSAPEAASGERSPADGEGWQTYLPHSMTLQKRKDGNFMYILHTTSANLTTFTADPFREAGWTEEEIIAWKEAGEAGQTIKFTGQVEVIARPKGNNWEVKHITR